MDSKRSFKGIDVFPKNASSSVERLAYPEKNFKFWASNKNVKVFVLFMDEFRKIYFCKHEMNKKILDSLPVMGKECQKFERFHPESIEWSRIANRYQRNPEQKFRKNADIRMSFKLENQFLAKAYFTFGLRTVKEGSVHLIQTLDVPLLFFLLPKSMHRRVKVEDKIFHYEHIHYFDRRILLPNGAYKVPAGTTYMLFTTQKTFFSLDVLEGNFQIPFPADNPVTNRVARLENTFDVPPQTPYIDDERDEDDDRFKMPLALDQPSTSSYCPPPKRAKTQVESEFSEFFSTLDPAAVSEICSNPVDDSQTSNFSEAASFPQPAPQQITYWLIPNPPVSERNVVTASVDFVKNFQILTSKTTDDPKAGFFPNNNPEEPDPEPLDLTFRGTPNAEDGAEKSNDSNDWAEKSNDSNDWAEKLNDSNFDNLDSGNHHMSEEISGNADFAAPRLNSENFELDLEAIIDAPFDPKEEIYLDNIISDLCLSSPMV